MKKPPLDLRGLTEWQVYFRRSKKYTLKSPKSPRPFFKKITFFKKNQFEKRLGFRTFKKSKSGGLNACGKVFLHFGTPSAILNFEIFLLIFFQNSKNSLFSVNFHFFLKNKSIEEGNRIPKFSKDKKSNIFFDGVSKLLYKSVILCHFRSKCPDEKK